MEKQLWTVDFCYMFFKTDKQLSYLWIVLLQQLKNSFEHFTYLILIAEMFEIMLKLSIYQVVG